MKQKIVYERWECYHYRLNPKKTNVFYIWMISSLSPDPVPTEPLNVAPITTTVQSPSTFFVYVHWIPRVETCVLHRRSKNKDRKTSDRNKHRYQKNLSLRLVITNSKCK